MIVTGEQLCFSAALPADMDVVNDILSAAAQELHIRGIRQWREPWDREEIAREIERGVVFLCRLGGELSIAVYFLNTESENRPLCTQKEDCFYLYHLALHPGFQRLGFGRRIISHIQQMADAAGRNVYLDCWDGNQKLKVFYALAGFERLGVMDEADYQIQVFRYRAQRSPTELR